MTANKVSRYSPYLGTIDLDYGKTPIIVFTVGKVGSKTVVESIYKLDDIPYSIYHAHVLSDAIENFVDNKASTTQFKSTNDYLNFNKVLGTYVAENFDKHRWKVITLVREPLSIILSTFFEFLDIGVNLQHKHPELFKNNILNISYSDFCKFYNLKFAYMTGDYIINWFDIEMKKVFGIDVYDHEFNKSKGYTIIEQKNVDLLVLRLEQLNENFAPAIDEFLGIKNIEMIKENIGDNRHFSKHMTFLKENLRVQKHVSDHFYSSKFAKHFYTDEEIEALRKRWELKTPEESIAFSEYSISESNIFEGLTLWKKKLASDES